MAKALKKDKTAHPIEHLVEVMARLRDPEGGCPWDLEQNFRSIAPYTIEEAYEVADAIERGDMKDLREELGDLLLQSVYHAQMASEAGHFTIEDVIQDITDKMIHRHPHVFGDGQAGSAEDVNKLWDERKALEKDQVSALDGVAKALPALLQAEKLQKKAAKTGFEWAEITDVLDKLDEEIAEMRAALQGGDTGEAEEEFGDILFVLVNYARMHGINAETALRRCNEKFIKRFKGMEEDFKKSNQKFSDASLDQMIRMWKVQKKKEN